MKHYNWVLAVKNDLVAIEKKRLRAEVLALRRALSKTAIACESEHITRQICTWAYYRAARTVMLFVSMPDEVDMEQLIWHALRSGKIVCIPYLSERYGDMEAARISGLNELVAGRLGIREPKKEEAMLVPPDSLDLIIVPGVAYDFAGRRCGMGAGYYDRFLRRARNAVWAGVALQCQLVSKVPCDEHDYAVQYVISSKEIRKCGEGKM
ncbi:5-formyltetrahydrofolate cyclo-ligase [Propionispora sp. 2/2-37]|uniref:5-formyltetrahydrofolate cyclo-ligase n=1 Tax=Propionispora sp. 2/2-37 TaxID=1677858 RepID=UPI0006BB96EC|nr:5-formyltetrahydrofolate cyclo-ligase [Propionispora sp. 2/2-37]